MEAYIYRYEIFDHFLQAGNMLHIHHDSCSSFLRRIDDIDPHSTHDGSPISIYDKEGRKKEKKKKILPRQLGFLLNRIRIRNILIAQTNF